MTVKQIKVGVSPITNQIFVGEQKRRYMDNKTRYDNRNPVCSCAACDRFW